MIRKTARELSESFQADLDTDFEFKPHVFPRYHAPVIGWRDGGRKLRSYQFGLIPQLEWNTKPKVVLHNARVETLHQKPSFRKAFAKQRCLIPLDWFYEYLNGQGGKKELFIIKPKFEGTLLAAGLFDRWLSSEGQWIQTFTMITRPASEELMNAGHDRSPFFLTPTVFDDWISGRGGSPREWFEILHSGRFEPGLRFERVNSKTV